MRFVWIKHSQSRINLIIRFVFSVEGLEQKQTACYDIDVEVDDTLKTQMNNFLLSTASQQEIQVIIIIMQTAWWDSWGHIEDCDPGRGIRASDY